MLWWKVVSGDGDNWSALPRGAAVIETGVTVQPVCKTQGLCLRVSCQRKSREDRANGCVVHREHSLLIGLFVEIKEKTQKSEKMPTEASPCCCFWDEAKSSLCGMIIFYVSLKVSRFISASIKMGEVEHFCGSRKCLSHLAATQVWDTPAPFLCLIGGTVFHFAFKMLQQFCKHGFIVPCSVLSLFVISLSLLWRFCSQCGSGIHQHPAALQLQAG